MFDTRREAEHFARVVETLGAARALDELEQEALHSTEPTLDQWAARHFASLTGVTAGTRVSYERIYVRTWSSLLGRYRCPPSPVRTSVRP